MEPDPSKAIDGLIKTIAKREKLNDCRFAQLTILKDAIKFVAGHLTTDYGDESATEDEFGLDASEVVEMAHDNMIHRAREALEQCERCKREYGIEL